MRKKADTPELKSLYNRQFKLTKSITDKIKKAQEYLIDYNMRAMEYAQFQSAQLVSVIGECLPKKDIGSSVAKAED
jgi:hypothetical protein